MVRPILILLMCLLGQTTQAQNPGWSWARGAGSAGTENAFGISAQSNGNTYVTGQFDGNTITFGNTVLTGNGLSDIFLAKYDASGSVLWAKNIGGKGYDAGIGIASDSNGNCYVTGSFEDTVSFDNVVLTAKGGTDIFVAKYNGSGSLLWARSAGSFMLDGGNSITLDRTGNSYVTGVYSGNMTLGTTSLVNMGQEDLFIAKYDPSGNLLWAQGAGGSGIDWATDIATDKKGNAYLTGWFNSASLTFGGKTINNAGQNDLFIVRFDPSGNVLWAKNANGPGSDQSWGIDVDTNNSSYITGYFNGGSLSFGSTTLSNAGGQDIFLVKYDSVGNAMWAKRSGGPEDDMGYAVATDARGYSYITGWFVSSNISFGGTVLQNAGPWPLSNLFVAGFDPSGNVVWAKSAGDAGMDVGNGIDLDGVGNCYLTGSFGTTISFGAHTLNAVGGSDMFIAKIPVGSMGIKATGAVADFKIFPNPVSGRLHIFTTGREQQSLQVFDTTGRLVLDREIAAKESYIDVQQWPAGLYLIRAGQEWQTFLKQ